MRRLRALWYGLARAGAGLARSPAASAAVVGAVAVGFLLVGAVHLLAHNLDDLTRTWAGGAHMVVYLEDGADADEIERLREALIALPGVTRATHITQAQALARLRRSLGHDDSLAILLEDDRGATMLPASIEVTFAAGVHEVARAHPLVARVEAATAVEEVVFVGDDGERLEPLMSGLRYGMWGFLGLMALACVYVVAITMRLRARAHRREAEILAIVGATSAFVRGPMLVAGAAQGVLGAIVALVALGVGFAAVAEIARAALHEAVGAGSIHFLPPAHLAIFVAAGAGVGLFGSWMGTRRYAPA
ncbi:cell division protein FtsX [Haliangium sp.]|uniref:cell division protein FtsX n=1 Tax=Haliangium sp. TaxID=2663208 RepID=UPI003D0C1973